MIQEIKKLDFDRYVIRNSVMLGAGKSYLDNVFAEKYHEKTFARSYFLYFIIICLYLSTVIPFMTIEFEKDYIRSIFRVTCWFSALSLATCHIMYMESMYDNAKYEVMGVPECGWSIAPYAGWTIIVLIANLLILKLK